MFEINDALAHQIIRHAHEPIVANRGVYQLSHHPLNTGIAHGRAIMKSPAALVATLATGLRNDIARLTALVAPRPTAPEACCPATA